MKKTMISNISRKWSGLVKLLLSYLISVTSDDDSISHKDYEMHKGREWMMAVIRAVLSQPLLFNFLKTFKDFVLLCLRPVLNEWLITSIRRLWLFIRLQVCMKSHHGAVFFAAQLYSGAEIHSNSVAACNYPESQWFYSSAWFKSSLARLSTGRCISSLPSDPRGSDPALHFL